jgi:superfamily II DNA or RNA helicase
LAAWREARRLLALTRAKRDTLRSLLDRHGTARMLIFTADNASAYAIAREHLIMPLTCDIGRQERDQVLDAFRQGQLRALVSSRVLNEGLDVPDADVAIIVGGALGEREHVQRIGRLLRPGPSKRALVYELVTRQTLEVSQAWRRRQGLAVRHSAQL